MKIFQFCFNTIPLHTYFQSGTEEGYETIQFIDPALWGTGDVSPYKDYYPIDPPETVLENKLIARMPAEHETYMKDSIKLMQFTTDNDPDVDIWFRSTLNFAGSRILWRYSYMVC